jgi:hypothetical protein
VNGYAYFNMRGGIIHHNEAENAGGGVFVNQATFIMNGGEIAANKAYHGGGVYVYTYRYFNYDQGFKKEPLPGATKSGTIWGYPANGKENYANGPAVWFTVYTSGLIVG